MIHVKPCYKFKNVSFEEQMKKNQEEFEEIKIAWKKFKYMRFMNSFMHEDLQRDTLVDLGMEIVDLQVCCETLLLQLGFNKSDRKELRKLVYDKNNKRGYYDQV